MSHVWEKNIPGIVRQRPGGAWKVQGIAKGRESAARMKWAKQKETRDKVGEGIGRNQSIQGFREILEVELFFFFF